MLKAGQCILITRDIHDVLVAQIYEDLEGHHTVFVSEIINIPQDLDERNGTMLTFAKDYARTYKLTAYANKQFKCLFHIIEKGEFSPS
jgi:hypothetical protein